MLLSKATYNNYICQKIEKQQCIAVSTVRMLIEPSANCLVNPFPMYNKDHLKSYKNTMTF